MIKLFNNCQLVIALLMAFAAINISHADGPSKISSCRERVVRFLSRPSEKTLSALGGAVGSRLCWSEIDSTNKNLNRLLELVKSGNSWGAKYLVQHLNRLDGGNLEDSLVALGQFGDRCPADLLTFAKNGSLSGRELADAVTMLPLSMSDDPAAQLKAMQRRRTHITKVNDNDLADKKAIALKAIDSFMAEMVSHQ